MFNLSIDTDEDQVVDITNGGNVTLKNSDGTTNDSSFIEFGRFTGAKGILNVQGVGSTLDVLLETGWVRMRGRRKTPGRPVTYGTSNVFLDHFGLESARDLPGIKELRAAGLLDNRVPPGLMPGIRDEEPESDAPAGDQEDMFD